MNKRGYATLLPGPMKFFGDTGAMLDARDRFQASGAYEPLRRAIVAAVAAENPVRILDVGCGTGYYLRGVTATHEDASVRALGMDLSPTAVSRAVRGDDRIDGLVADVWSSLPIRDGAADVVLNVFAPRNAAEFHRVLRSGGSLFVVIPQPIHLQELRSAGLAVGIQHDKAAHLVDALATYFILEKRVALSELLTVSRDTVADLVGMGPSAHHTGSAVADVGNPVPHFVTAAFELFTFRRRDA